MFLVPLKWVRLTVTSCHIAILVQTEIKYNCVIICCASFAGLPDTDRDRLSFQEHRRAHYDEFRKVKELLQKGSLLSDDEDDDREKQEGCSTCSSLTGGIKAIEIDGARSTRQPQPTRLHQRPASVD